MKSIRMILLALVIFGVPAQAQEVFNVTRVSGKITNLSSGKAVSAGDALNPTDQLLFESPESYAIAVGEDLRRFQLKIHESLPQEQVLTSSALDAARPTKMRSLMLARFDPTEQEISDLRHYFGNERFSIIGDRVSIPLSPKSYPLSDNKFIVFFYRVENSPISKKIGHQDQTLLVERDKLTTSSAGNILGDEISNVAVFQYEASTRSSREITRITLVFVDKNDLRKEFNTIIPILRRQRMAEADIKKYLIEYYFDFYGATDSRTIYRIVDEIVQSFQPT